MQMDGRAFAVPISLSRCKWIEWIIRGYISRRWWDQTWWAWMNINWWWTGTRWGTRWRARWRVGVKAGWGRWSWWTRGLVGYTRWWGRSRGRGRTSRWLAGLLFQLLHDLLLLRRYLEMQLEEKLEKRRKDQVCLDMHTQIILAPFLSQQEITGCTHM